MTRFVPYDRLVMVHSLMIVGCPERKLNRQADNRSDLTRAGYCGERLEGELRDRCPLPVRYAP